MNSSKKGIEVEKEPATPVCYRMPEDAGPLFFSYSIEILALR
jgi:hypothetical protein